MGACSSSQTMEDQHTCADAELVDTAPPQLDLQHFKLMQLLGVGGFGVVYSVKPSRRLQSFVERYRRNSLQLHQRQLLQLQQQQQQQLNLHQQTQSMEFSHSDAHHTQHNTTHHDERRLSISGMSDAHHHSPHHLHLPPATSHHDAVVNITSGVAVINHSTPIPSNTPPLTLSLTSTAIAACPTLLPSASNSSIFSNGITTISSCPSSLTHSPSSPPSPSSLLSEIYCLKRMSKQSTLRSRFRLDSAFNERDIGVENAEAISLDGDFGAQFLLPLLHAFQSDTELMFVMPLCRGGNLLQLMKRRDRCMTSDEAKFYTAEIVLGLQSLHRRNIVHRDLKHANVLLDDDGHVKICDFGLASYLLPEYGYRVRSDVGTDGYGAPEMRKNFTHHHHKTTATSTTTTAATNTTTTATSTTTAHAPAPSVGYGTSVDYYALGIMLYEMLHGHHLRPTNYQERQQRRAERQKQIQLQQQQQQHTTQPTSPQHITPTPTPPSSSSAFLWNLDLSDHVVAQQELHTFSRCYFGPSVPSSARALIVSLLCADPCQRLGCRNLLLVNPEEGGKNGRFAKGWEEVKQHSFFEGVDWNAMARRQITPPYVPPPPPFIVTSSNNTNMNNNNNNGADTSSYKPLPINEADQHLFDGWEYNATIDRVGQCSPTRSLKQPASPINTQLQLQTTMIKEKSGAAADMMQVDTMSVASTKAHDAQQLQPPHDMQMPTKSKALPWSQSTINPTVVHCQ